MKPENNIGKVRFMLLYYELVKHRQLNRLDQGTVSFRFDHSYHKKERNSNVTQLSAQIQCGRDILFCRFLKVYFVSISFLSK